MRKTKNFLGFTMIELLITIAVIGALASIGLIAFTGQQKSARDTQRKSDLQQYRIALENYANANNSAYPGGTGMAVNSLCASGAALSNFMSGCPAGNPYSYQYTSGSGGYVLWVELERSGNNWVACSGGKSGERTKSGFSAADGVCPI